METRDTGRGKPGKVGAKKENGEIRQGKQAGSKEEKGDERKTRKILESKGENQDSKKWEHEGRKKMAEKIKGNKEEHRVTKKNERPRLVLRGDPIRHASVSKSIICSPLD